MNIALDAVALAHIATKLEWDNGPVKQWEEKVAKAMDRLAAAWEEYEGTDENPEAEEALNIALDEIAVAHSAATFEWANGPLKW